MPQNIASINITKEQSAAALQLISQFNQLMEGLVALEPGERKSARTLGPKSEQYVRGVILSLQQNAEIVPRSIDVTGAAASLESMDNLLPVLKAWQQVLERLQDTVYLLGSDVMIVANQGFKLMKLFGKVQGLEEITKELSYRHAKSRRKKTPPPDLPDA